MGRIQALLLTGTMLLGMAEAGAQTPSTVRVRGAIAAMDGAQMQVKTREGKELRIAIAADTAISVLQPRSMDDIKQGSFVGITAVREGPGTPWRAREVHIFDEAHRGSGEGHYDWDLEPGSSMTNGNIDSVVSANDGKHLTLGYRGGRQKIVVPPGTPIVAFEYTDRSVLKPGVHIFCIARQEADGSLTARRISAGKDGTKPPM